MVFSSFSFPLSELCEKKIKAVKRKGRKERERENEKKAFFLLLLPFFKTWEREDVATAVKAKDVEGRSINLKLDWDVDKLAACSRESPKSFGDESVQMEAAAASLLAMAVSSEVIKAPKAPEKKDAAISPEDEWE